LKKENISVSREKAIKIVAVMKERVTFPNDFWEQGRFFFFPPNNYEEGVVAKKWNQEAVKVLSAFKDAIKTESSLTATSAKEILEKVTAALAIGTGKILQALRLSITGAGGGPDLMMIMEIIGKDEVISRIEHALKTLKVKVS
jgi:glutamyl-tRNA synthetase